MLYIKKRYIHINPLKYEQTKHAIKFHSIRSKRELSM